MRGLRLMEAQAGRMLDQICWRAKVLSTLLFRNVFYDGRRMESPDASRSRLTRLARVSQAYTIVGFLSAPAICVDWPDETPSGAHGRPS